MRGFILAALTALAVSGCATAPTPQQVALQGCDTYARSLSVLAAARVQGRLTTAQVGLVDQVNAVVTPVCTSPTPPQDAQSTLDQANAALEALIFQTQQVNQ